MSSLQMNNDSARPERLDLKCPDESTRLLSRGLRELYGGEGRAFFITGPPGSGRTTMLGELATAARASQIRIVASAARDEWEDVLVSKIIRSLDSGSTEFAGKTKGKTTIERIYDQSRARLAPRALPHYFESDSYVFGSANLAESLRRALARAAFWTPI